MIPRIGFSPAAALCAAVMFCLPTPTAISAPVAENATKRFDVPAGVAQDTLKQFSAQSRVQLVYATDLVRGVRTNAVKGEQAPLAALEMMLAGTVLTAVPDATPGAFAVRKGAADPNATTAAPVQVAALPEAKIPATDEAVELSPFEVRTDRTDTYQSTNTNSLAGINTPLSRVPISAEVLNRTLLDDLGADSLNRVLGDFLALGSPVISFNELGRGGLDGDDFSSGGLRSRGLAATASRNSLGSGEIAGLDGYAVERVEVIRGPQSLLYGPGEPGGVINYVTKQARLSHTRGSATLRLNSEGSERGEVDLNTGTGTMAVRFVGLRENHKTWRVNLGRRHEGALLSLVARPTKAVTFRADYQRLMAVNINATINFGMVYRAPAGAPADPRANVNLTRLVAEGNAGGLANGILNFSTVDSFLGNGNFRARDADSFSASAEAVLTDWFSLQVRYAHDDLTSTLGLANDTNGLRGATDPANLATGHWAVGYTPGRRQIVNELDSGRLLANAKLPTLRWVKSSLTFGSDWQKSFASSQDRRFYRLNQAGEILQDPAQLASATGGRFVMPVQWVPIDTGNFSGPFNRKQTVVAASDGFSYKLAPLQIEGVLPPTPTNPRGVNGGFPSSTSRTMFRLRSAQAVWIAEWFDGRFDTLVGYRANSYESSSYFTGDARHLSSAARNLGALWHFHREASVYYGYSSSNNLPTAAPTYFGTLPGLSQGRAHEIGLKLDLFEGRLSGSITGYTGEQKNATQNLAFRGILDPVGINGSVVFAIASMVFDVEVRGVEVALSAQPARGFSLRFSFANQDGKTGTSVELPRRYNDEFNVLVANGVRVVAVNIGGVLTPLDPPGVATTLPVANLTNPASGQFAVLNPDSGVITNAAALGLTTPGVGTGRVGLPITEHQLGWTPPGGNTITVLRGGEKTVGYPEQSFSLAASYRVSRGLLRGMTVGINGSYQPNFRQYWVSDQQVGRYIFYRSDLFNTGAFASYEFRVGSKLRLKSQLNISNMFDTQSVDIRPNPQTGALNVAGVMYTPRLFTWSNTVAF